MPITRRRIRTVLAALWILDGLLQLQRSMFTTVFARQVLAPAGQGQPWIVSEPVALTARIVAEHPLPWDLAFAAIQLGVGVGFLLPRLVRPALTASVVWAAGVWCLGEGLGGIAGGHADLLTGAPGAVILYAVLAIAVWPRVSPGGAEYEPLPEWLAAAWAALWLGGAVLRLLPGQGSSAIASEIRANADGSPGWLGHIDSLTASTAGSIGTGLVVAWVVACLGIGLGGLRPGTSRSAAAVAGGVCATVFWFVGQSLGELWSGTATDPNAGPLIVLMAFAIVGIGASAPAYGRHRRHAGVAAVQSRRRGKLRNGRESEPGSVVPSAHGYPTPDVLPGAPPLQTRWAQPARSAERALVPAFQPAPRPSPVRMGPPASQLAPGDPQPASVGPGLAVPQTRG
jgi:hypothetical protein